MMPRLKVNLFQLEPDHENIDLFYIPYYDARLISGLIRNDLLVGGMPYSNLKSFLDDY